MLINLQFNDLQQCYLQKRRQVANPLQNLDKRDADSSQREGYSSGLSDFQSVLSTFTQYRYLSMNISIFFVEPFQVLITFSFFFSSKKVD